MDNRSTVAALLDRYQREALPALAARTQEEYRRQIVHLNAAFGERIAEELRPRDFGAFLDVQTGKTQRVKGLAVLSACFTRAVHPWYLLERNVLRDVTRPTPKPRDRLVSDQEFAAFKVMAPERIRLAMDLALLTGQRQGDILAFRWADIKRVTEAGETFDELHICQSKTGKRMAIRVTTQLEAILDRCRKLEAPGEYILRTHNGEAYTPAGFRSCWQLVQQRWIAAGNEGFHFHDIRALCATKCATLEAARALLGHSSPAITRRVYRRGIERVQPLQL